jgi:hypothetical protein
MLRRLLSLALAASLAGAPFSCAGDATVEPRGETGRGIEDPLDGLARIEDELGASAEVQELLAMLKEVSGRLEERGMTPRDLARLESTKGVSAVEALGYSIEEAERFQSRLEALRDTLLARYPELRALVPETAAAPCGAEAPRRSDDVNEVPLDPPVKGSNRVTCKWGPFVIALIACANAAIAAGGNPGVYFICAYQALCSYCGGGWVDSACN